MAAINNLSEAITSLSTSVTNLTKSVDNAVTHIGNPGADDVQLNALTQSVQSIQAAIDAQTTRLSDAVANTAPTPQPVPVPPATP